MSTDANTTTEPDERQRWSPWAIAAMALLLLIFGMIAFGALRGCLFSDTQESAEQTEKKKKDDAEKKEDKAEFVLKPPVVLPSEPDVPLPPAKPGHWATASQLMRANYRDFVGDSRLSITDSQHHPFPVPSTPFQVRSSRPVLLTKGRYKATQTTFFIPQVTKTVNIALDLAERTLGSGPPQSLTPLTPMPSYQYHLVVLANTPARYSFIKTIDSVKVPFNGINESDDSEDTLHYRVVELGANDVASLPDNPLTWTSIAYVVWDDIDPGEPFPTDQKKALVDWLHWGGQLIINGPDSLDKLKGSFLEPYLPAVNGGTQKYAPDDTQIQELSDNWIISNPPKAPGAPLRPTVPWSGIKLTLRDKQHDHFLPNTGNLFAERQIGRGRVVVSAIQLSERDFINWRSGFESFFNACLLRRPPRTYHPGAFGGVTINWAEEPLQARRLDAALNTRLRFFSRDLGITTSYHFENATDEDPTQSQLPQTPAAIRGRMLRSGAPQTIREYRAPENPGGLGAWNDFSLTANAAREALREAAGVEVPNAGFVVFCLGAYLVALVPLNWAIFRAVGRLEWAWVAAPVIAIAGTWVIVQRARLDIGFVRSQTEIGILEQQPDHARAHLSRFTALYTSLSTNYDFEFANMTTLIAPFASELNPPMLTGEGLSAIDFLRYDNVRLTGMPISSNSTGMVHSEQMFGVDGTVSIGRSSVTNHEQIENHSNLDLRSACVVRLNALGEVEGIWLGDLAPKHSVALANFKQSFNDERKKEVAAASRDRLNLEPMFKIALDPKYIEKGELRLVARVDEVLPGEKISPAASQVKGATLVVAHLRYGALPQPKKDHNTRQEIKTEEPDDKNPIEF